MQPSENSRSVIYRQEGVMMNCIWCVGGSERASVPSGRGRRRVVPPGVKWGRSCSVVWWHRRGGCGWVRGCKWLYLLFSLLTRCKVPYFEIDVVGWTALIKSLTSEVPPISIYAGDLCSRHKTHPTEAAMLVAVVFETGGGAFSRWMDV